MRQKKNVKTEQSFESLPVGNVFEATVNRVSTE